MQSFLRREAPITTSPPSLIVFVGTSGGAGKTTATGLTCTALTLSGVLTRIIELDEQRRHAHRHVTVTSVNIPTAAELRNDTEADDRALSQGYESTLRGFEAGEVVLWDTGANVDERVAAFFGRVDMESELPEGGPAVIVIMVRNDREMIRLAAKTEAAFRRAMPKARIAIGVNDANSYWSRLDPDSDNAAEAKAILGPTIKRGGSLHVHAIPTGLALAMRDSDVAWETLADMDATQAAEYWKVPRAVARSRQGELAAVLEQARQEIVRQLGFPADAD
ncbi:hypothetical protein JKG68_07170 [Microvirga aerilata]|uniref:Uncharacterized protein n=1 Tax=Microvirga aerilata TaxID=670292 RepID=A0A937CXC4_9HYPH|nr:hypothetical protein [Microvirga aerilata]MBL0403739.1 hypothetical protein [Microvirga aerilata]